MLVQQFAHEGEGIQCVYDNQKWIVCIKNWKPNNNIDQIKALEIHYKTDEQFIPLMGKAILITAARGEAGFEDIELTLMELGKVYNVPKGVWYNTITQHDTKLVYVQDSATELAPGNSEYIDMTPEELKYIQEKAAALLA